MGQVLKFWPILFFTFIGTILSQVVDAYIDLLHQQHPDVLATSCHFATKLAADPETASTWFKDDLRSFRVAIFPVLENVSLICGLNIAAY